MAIAKSAPMPLRHINISHSNPHYMHGATTLNYEILQQDHSGSGDLIGLLLYAMHRNRPSHRS